MCTTASTKLGLTLVVLRLLASSLPGHFAQVLNCAELTGERLQTSSPFVACGELIGVNEGRSHLLDYFPLPMHSGCARVCINVTTFEAQFAFDWCAGRPKPSMLLKYHIQDVDWIVVKRRGIFLFYGCSANYRVQFKILSNASCDAAACVPMIAYSASRSDLPPPFSDIRPPKLNLSIPLMPTANRIIYPTLKSSAYESDQLQSVGSLVRPGRWIAASWCGVLATVYLVRSSL